MQVDVKPDIALLGSSWLTGHPQVNFWFAEKPAVIARAPMECLELA